MRFKLEKLRSEGEEEKEEGKISHFQKIRVTILSALVIITLWTMFLNDF